MLDFAPETYYQADVLDEKKTSETRYGLGVVSDMFLYRTRSEDSLRNKAGSWRKRMDG